MEKILIVAAIPVKNGIKWTAPLVASLLFADEVDEIWIYDNGSTDETRYWIKNNQRITSRLKYFDASNMRFYEMWNDMIRRASDIGNVKLAILNNDIFLPHGAIKTIAENMTGYDIAQVDGRVSASTPINEVYASPIRWTERIGHAFVVNADFWKYKEYAIDPQYNIWYGDDDLFIRCVSSGGKICEIRGVGCSHAWGKSHEHYAGNIADDIRKDRQTFLRLWKG